MARAFQEKGLSALGHDEAVEKLFLEESKGMWYATVPVKIIKAGNMSNFRLSRLNILKLLILSVIRYVKLFMTPN